MVAEAVIQTNVHTILKKKLTFHPVAQSCSISAVSYVYFFYFSLTDMYMSLLFAAAIFCLFIFF